MHDCAEAIHVVQHSTGAVPARVIGLSLGGMFAQQLALDFPSDVEALLLVGTTSSVAPERRQVMLTRGEKIVAEGMESMVEESVARWVSPDGQDSVLAERVRAGLRAISPRNWANTWRVMADFDALSRLDQLRVPTLVMNGTADASTPPSVGAVTAAAIPGARQIAITDGAHFFPFEHPERFLPRTLEFLASIQTNHR